MYSRRVDPRNLVRRARGFEIGFPRAASIALNDSAFAARKAWQDEAPRVFDRPTALTRNAALVAKSTPRNLVAQVFIRDEVSGGTPPSRYLLPQVQGGARTQKPFEFLSHRQRSTLFAPYYVAGSDFPKDQFGNIPSGVIKKVQSQLQVAESVAGFRSNETFASRKRRLKRQKKKGIRGSSYFILRQDRGKLKARQVYERVRTGFGTTVRTVLAAVKRAPVYRKRYDVFKLAADVFDRNYELKLQRALRGLQGSVS